MQIPRISGCNSCHKTKAENKKSNVASKIITGGLTAGAVVAGSVLLAKNGKLAANPEGNKILEFGKKGLATIAEYAQKIFSTVKSKLVKNPLGKKIVNYGAKGISTISEYSKKLAEGAKKSYYKISDKAREEIGYNKAKIQFQVEHNTGLAGKAKTLADSAAAFVKKVPEKVSKIIKK